MLYTLLIVGGVTHRLFISSERKTVSSVGVVLSVSLIRHINGYPLPATKPTDICLKASDNVQVLHLINILGTHWY